MYSNILVPIDRMAPSKEAVEVAFDLAKRQDSATVHLLHVVDTKINFVTGISSGPLVEELSDQARENLEQIKSQNQDLETTVEVSVRTDPNPSRKILDFIDENDVDLVVMATHGRSGVPRLFLGSTTERTMRGTDVPVIAVPFIKEDNDVEENSAPETDRPS